MAYKELNNRIPKDEALRRELLRCITTRSHTENFRFHSGYVRGRGRGQSIGSAEKLRAALLGLGVSIESKPPISSGAYVKRVPDTAPEATPEAPSLWWIKLLTFLAVLATIVTVAIFCTLIPSIVRDLTTP